MALFHTTVLDNQIKALSTIGSASGSICTFDTDRAERLVKCVADISTSASKVYLANMSDITNKTYFEGLLNGTYVFIDLGVLNWTKLFDGTFLNQSIPTSSNSNIHSVNNNIVISSSQFTPIANGEWNLIPYNDNSYGVYQNQVRLKPIPTYTDPNDFKTAMSGVYLIYELLTPTTPTITKAQFETLLSAFGLSGWLFEYDLGETVSSGANLDCVSGILTRSDDTTKHVDGNVITAQVGINNVYCDTGDTEVNYIMTVGNAIS